jgi:hypothetical protein
MKYCARFAGCGLLFVLGCSSSPSDNNTNGVGAVAGTGTGVTPVTAGSTAPSGGVAGSRSAAGSGVVTPPKAGTTAPTGAAGTASAAGSGVSTGTGGTSAAAGGGGPTGTGGAKAAAGSGTGPVAGGGAAGGGAVGAADFMSVYTQVLSVMCPSCHVAGGVFPSLDLSTPALAYAALVDKDASTLAVEAGSLCEGKGKRVTPGNCETSLLYNKVAQAMPMCGNRMPLGTKAIPQAGLDTLCAWIKAGAKQ